MSLHHFFLDNQIIAQETTEVFPLSLASDDAKHARVLRLEPGEHVSVVDADQDYFECEIVSADKEGLLVRIAQKLDMPHMGPQVVVVQGVAKGDKMDMIIRHATEVGVAGFMPLMCERSVVKLDAKKSAARTQRWQTIAKSAAMQSGRLTVPNVMEPVSVAQAVQVLADFDAVIVCWEESTGGSLHAVVQSTLAHANQSKKAAVQAEQDPEVAALATQSARDAVRIAVVIGPEGGLSAQEVEQFSASTACHVVTLGSTILRTETAGIVAPSLVMYECGGLGNTSIEE